MLERVRETSQQIDRWFQDRLKYRWLALAVTNGSVYTALTVLVGGDSLRWGILLGAVCGITFATIYIGLESSRPTD